MEEELQTSAQKWRISNEYRYDWLWILKKISVSTFSLIALVNMGFFSIKVLLSGDLHKRVQPI